MVPHTPILTFPFVAARTAAARPKRAVCFALGAVVMVVQQCAEQKRAKTSVTK